METETIRQYRRELAKLQRRLDALERTAEEYCGQEIATGTATAIEITKRQIAEVEATLERISGTNRA
jgi:tRNA(Ser,Leu) C12 N-acetylase TAN1